MESPTRTLAAVWFADIVGFSTIASRDERAALELVGLFQDAARRQVAAPAGTIVKFVGDGMLAYSSSTSAALSSALALRGEFHAASQEQGSTARMRVGIHVGDVTIASDGDIYGDGVNIASRLQTEADPGRVVVSEDVWRQCRQMREFEFLPLGPRRLRGLAQPVWAYEASRAGDDHDAADGDDGGAAGHSIAVLPFSTLGRGEDGEVLAGGIQNDLTTELSKVPGLTVISRTSVMAYRNTDKPVPLIGRELNAATVVEGSVQSAGNRVRLNVQLVDARGDVHLWAENYDRELTAQNLFDIQTELTARIVKSLSSTLFPDQADAPSAPPTRSLDAYRLAAEGRMALDLRTEGGFGKAIALFTSAVEIDPGYSAAWVGLADSLALFADYGYGDRDEHLPRAEDAVRRALELEPDSAEAHTSLGLMHAARQNGAAAIQEFETAVALHPGYAEAWNWMSWVGLLVGWKERAHYAALRAMELNPLSPEAVSHVGMGLLVVGRPEEALAEARRAVELSPSLTSRFYEGLNLYELGRYDEARRVLEELSLAETGERAIPWAGLGPDASLALCHIASGNHDDATTILESVRSRDDAFASGLIMAAFGEIDNAFESFASVDSPRAWPALAVHHYYRTVWDPMRSDPRFEEVVAAVRDAWAG
jgi:TolB-like protein/Flp pilus assembly protein TadD